MPPKGHAELAHPQAADWVMGTLGPDQAVGFQLHLEGCLHCQAAIAEFGQLSQMLRHLPPAAALPPALEARTIASILAAAAEDRTATAVHQIPAGLLAAAEDRTATEIHQVPQATPAAADTASPPQLAEIPSALAETGTDQEPGGLAKIIRFPRWHGSAGLLAIASAAAAAIIAAVLILAGLGGGVPKGAFAFTLVPAAGSGLASGTALARPDASGSWNVTLTVHHLKNFEDKQWYQCWYVSRDGRQVASAGTFLVPDSGSGTFSMTSAADPSGFPTMKIMLQLPSTDGALHGQVVLVGTGKKL